MKLKFAIAVAVLMASCIGCGGRTGVKIYNYIESNYDLSVGDSCCIDLRHILGIDYDKGYLVADELTETEIEHIIKIPYHSKKHLWDDRCRMILLKKNAIIYEDSFPYGIVEFYDCMRRDSTLGFLSYVDLTYSKFGARKLQCDDGSYCYSITQSLVSDTCP